MERTNTTHLLELLESGIELRYIQELKDIRTLLPVQTS